MIKKSTYYINGSSSCIDLIFSSNKNCGIENFPIFTAKHLRWSLFLIQDIAKFLRSPILKNIGQRLLLKMCSEN